MNFARVTEGGMITVVATEQGPLLPIGFRHGNPPIYLNIETDAVFVGSLEICIDYSTLSFKSDPSNLKLAHFRDSINKWEDITDLPINTADQIICGSSNRLSRFAILELADPIES